MGSFLVLVAVWGSSPYSLSGCFACACVVVWLFVFCFSLFRWCLSGGVFLLAVYVFGVVCCVSVSFLVFCVGWSSRVRVWSRVRCGLGVPCCVVLGRSLCGFWPGVPGSALCVLRVCRLGLATLLLVGMSSLRSSVLWRFGWLPRWLLLVGC